MTLTHPAPHTPPGTDLVRVPLPIRILSAASFSHWYHQMPVGMYAAVLRAPRCQVETTMYRLIVDGLVTFCREPDCTMFPRDRRVFSAVPSPEGRALMDRYLHL